MPAVRRSPRYPPAPPGPAAHGWVSPEGPRGISAHPGGSAIPKELVCLALCLFIYLVLTIFSHYFPEAGVGGSSTITAWCPRKGVQLQHPTTPPCWGEGG